MRAHVVAGISESQAFRTAVRQSLIRTFREDGDPIDKTFEIETVFLFDRQLNGLSVGELSEMWAGVSGRPYSLTAFDGACSEPGSGVIGIDLGSVLPAQAQKACDEAASALAALGYNPAAHGPVQLHIILVG